MALSSLSSKNVTLTILAQLPLGSICGMGMDHTVSLDNAMSISHHGLDEVDPVSQLPLLDYICATSMPESRLSYYLPILQDELTHLWVVKRDIVCPPNNDVLPVSIRLHHWKPHSELNKST